MKHINFIQTVHPQVQNNFYRWVIWSFLLLGINIAVMGWLYIKQRHHINELTQEKMLLMHHEQEHNDILTCKKNITEKKKRYEQKVHKIDCHYCQPRYFLELLQALNESAYKNNVVIQSFIMKRQGISLQGAGSLSDHMVSFTRDFGKIPLLKEVELTSLEKSGAEIVGAIKGTVK